MSRWSAVALIAGLALWTGSVSASPYSSVVVFGDSNVDSGNLAAVGASLGITVNPPPNFGGRNNNGPVVVEYLANDLGAPLRNYSFKPPTVACPSIETA